MYEYKFAKVKFIGFKKEPKEDYQAMAITILTPPTIGYGTMDYYEFVF